MRFFLSLFAVCLLSASLAAQNSQRVLIPYLNAFLYGFQDKSGNVVIKPAYDYVLPFHENRAAVFLQLQANGRTQNKIGFIDKTGKEVIPVIYSDSKYTAEYLAEFSEGLAPVEKDGKMGFIDVNGRTVIPFIYDYAAPFSEGLAAVQVNHHVGFIDKTGKTVIPFDYFLPTASGKDQRIAFREGLAVMQRYNNKVSNPKFAGGNWCAIDRSGKQVLDLSRYDGVKAFSEGLAVVKKYIKVPDGLQIRFGYIDKTGKEVVPLQYDDAYSFSNGRGRVNKGAILSLGGKSGYIDRTGKEVIPLKYDVARDFSDGLAVVSIGSDYDDEDTDNLFYITPSGEMAFDDYFSYADDYMGKLALVNSSISPNAYYIDKKGNLVSRALAYNENTTGKPAGPANSKSAGPSDRTTPATSTIPDTNEDASALYDRAKKLYGKPEGFALFKTAAQKGLAKAMREVAELYSLGWGTEVDLKESAAWYRQAAYAGDSAGMHKLAANFYFGTFGIPLNKDSAIYWYHCAARAGNTESKNWLVANGLYKEKNYERFVYIVGSNGSVEIERGYEAMQDKAYRFALLWYEAAAQKGHPNGMLRTAMMYLNGYGTPKNGKTGAYWINKAAEKDEPTALFIKGMMHKTGTPEFPLNNELYVSLVQKAAALGNESAKKELGQATAQAGQTSSSAGNGPPGTEEFRKGLAAEKQGNKEETVKWYQAAIEKGNSAGMTALGSLYSTGKVVEKNTEEAKRLLQMAIEKGNEIAMFNMGNMHLLGNGVPKNEKEAFRYYFMSANKGYPTAMYNIAIMYSNGNGVMENKTEAFSWYKKSAEKGEARAMANLGYSYMKALGTVRDLTAARQWLEKSAEKGNAAAMQNLGALYYQLEYHIVDYDKAVYWFQKSVDAGNQKALPFLDAAKKKKAAVDKLVN